MTEATPTARPAAGPLTGNFWRFAILFSFVVNIILVIALIGALAFIFEIKNQIAQPLVGGLSQSFAEMNRASIITTIPVNETITVNDSIPVVFDLPLNQQTNVILTESTLVPQTTVYLNGVPIRTNIVLPPGTSLPVQLSMVVPVSQTIPVTLKVPVSLNVAVNIPLAQTELSRPFTRLSGVIDPYNALLNDLPSSWNEALFGR